MVLDIPRLRLRDDLRFSPQTTSSLRDPKSKFENQECFENQASSFNSRGFRGPGTRNQTLNFVSICACWDETAVKLEERIFLQGALAHSGKIKKT